MAQRLVFLFLLILFIEVLFASVYHYQATGPLAETFASHTQALESGFIPPAEDIDFTNDPWVKVAHFESTFGQVTFVVDMLVGFVVAAFLVFGGISKALANKVRTLSSNAHVSRALFLIMLVGVTTALYLPLSVSGFIIESLRGTSLITAEYAIFGVVQDFFMQIIFTLATVVPLYWIIDRYPKIWWSVGAVFMSLFSIFTMYVSPVLIDPLYIQVAPLPAGEVQEALSDVLKAADVPLERVFVSDASLSTYESNAMVTGLGSTKRMILDDTLLTFFTPEEIRTIVAHELGHYVFHHLWYDIALSTVFTFVTFFLIAIIMRWLVTRYGARIGATRINDIALYPVLSTLLFTVPLFYAPIQSYVSRSFEHQADVYEVELTRTPQASIDSFKKMAYQGFVDVDPPRLLQLWFGTHPTFLERIAYYESQK